MLLYSHSVETIAGISLAGEHRATLAGSRKGEAMVKIKTTLKVKRQIFLITIAFQF
jgi:hypothetical protein